MDPILRLAREVLRRDPAPALRLHDLLDRVRSQGPEPRLSEERLRALLRSRPDRFRVLELCRGPFRALGPSTEGAAGVGRDATWVTALTDPDAPAEPRDATVLGRLRESVRWLARDVDARSPRAVLRWYRLVLEAEDVRASVRRVA